MINLLIKSATNFEKSVDGFFFCFFSTENSDRILSRCELGDCTEIINRTCQACDMCHIPLCARVNGCFAQVPMQLPEPWLEIDYLVFRK